MPDKKDAVRVTNEQGSALVLVMFIALLLTILGTAVLSAAIGGAQRTETRKNDVQSLHLAEKALEETIAYITAELESKVKLSNDSNRGDLHRAIDSYLRSLDGSIGAELSTSTELEQANGRITGIEYKPAGDSVSYTLILTAEADVNGVQRELTQEVVFDTYPDFLKYVLGSEGNLTINGSPEVRGNIYAGKKLYISDTALYDYKSNNLSLPSSPFELTAAGGKTGSGEAHVQSLDEVIYSRSDRTGSRSAAEMLKEPDPWPGILPMDKLIIKNHRKFVQMNVEESFLDKVMEAIGEGRAGVDRNHVRGKIRDQGLADYLGNYFTKVELPLVKPVQPLVPEDSEEPEDIELWRSYYEELNSYNEKIDQITNPDETLVIKGDLTIDGIEMKKIEYMGGPGERPWYIVDGNLKMDNYNEELMKVAANLLVTGSLEIRGDVQLDSTMFVLGRTTVEDASIRGAGAVVISKGPVLVNRFDAFQNTTETLNAFFYTDATAELYGVGSIFSLNGGFFAKGDLTVNAVRGEAKDGGSVIQVNDNGLIRFTANYDEQVYVTHAAGLPRVNNISVQVGHVKLK
ncbi:hypothetical protein [Paenibacillus dakarensis]|uniref:hypothetical protein n=1 Tax=Paenibacillus dakarensis TaxID=1527293 RepID=UPI0006D557EC|nr:hypothetical protein [Paenibacillus dakarensis]